MDAVEKEIQKALKDIPVRASAEGWQSDTLWTAAVKQALIDVGQSNGYFTAANGCNSDDGCEWLYDVVWYQSDKANHILDFPLVAECEWKGPTNIKCDFEKLMVARSKYRVMVFQANNDQKIKSLLNDMKTWIRKFRRTAIGDRYFFAGWSKDHWIFKHYVVKLV